MAKREESKAPGLFDGYEGNLEEERRILARAGLLFDRDHLVHAFLLEGGRDRVQSVSRALVLRILADFGGVERERILSGSAADLLFEGEERVPIDRVRQLTALMYQKPIQGDYKVIVIDRADTMQGPAQNSLLKSLEEPPGHVVWILGASQRSKLLLTVQSRLRMVALGKGHPPVDDPLALDLLGDLLAGKVEGVFLSKALLENWQEDYSSLLEAWIYYLNGVMAYQSGDREVDLPLSCRADFFDLAQNTTLDRASRALLSVEKTRQGLEKNWNPKLALEDLCLTLAGKQGVSI